MYGIFRRGSKSVADINTGSPKALLFDIFTVLSLLFLPPRGGKLHWQLRWLGHGRICPPGSATESWARVSKSCARHKIFHLHVPL